MQRLAGILLMQHRLKVRSQAFALGLLDHHSTCPLARLQYGVAPQGPGHNKELTGDASTSKRYRTQTVATVGVPVSIEESHVPAPRSGQRCVCMNCSWQAAQNASDHSHQQKLAACRCLCASHRDVDNRTDGVLLAALKRSKGRCT